MPNAVHWKTKLTQKHAQCCEDLVCIGSSDILGVGPRALGGVPDPIMLVGNRKNDAKHEDGSQHHRSIHHVRHLEHMLVIKMGSEPPSPPFSPPC